MQVPCKPLKTLIQINRTRPVGRDAERPRAHCQLSSRPEANRGGLRVGVSDSNCGPTAGPARGLSPHDAPAYTAPGTTGRHHHCHHLATAEASRPWSPHAPAAHAAPSAWRRRHLQLGQGGAGRTCETRVVKRRRAPPHLRHGDAVQQRRCTAVCGGLLTAAPARPVLTRTERGTP